MSEKMIAIKSLRGPGGLIDLGKGHRLEFNLHGVAMCPKNQEKFWKSWSEYGREILTLEDYMKREADKRIKEIKEMVKMYVEEMPDPEKFLDEVAKEIKGEKDKEKPEIVKGLE